MKIPTQRRPQHHGDMARGRGGIFEVAAGRHRDGRDEERVALQRWLGETMGDGELLGGRRWLLPFPHVYFAPAADSLLVFGVKFVFGLEVDGPARWHGRLMQIEVIGFEGEAAKDGSHRVGLAVG